jgi:type II secretory pathway pseudopilin PulG
MKLRRQEQGYAMAALLVTLSVMAVMMTVLMPAWKHMAQREKEAELVFRGEQYGRALMLFTRKHGPGTTPPTIDVLVLERELRKKYKDPITNDDFQVILMGQNTPGSTQPGTTPGRGGASMPTEGARTAVQRPGGPGTGSPSGTGSPLGQAPGQGAGVGGIWGVASKSKDQSIRIYKGRTHYNEWVFNAPQQPQVPGAGAPGSIPGVGPGGRGGPGGAPTGIPGTGGPGGRGIGPGGRGGPVQPIGPGRGNPFPFPTPPPTPRGRGPGG